MRPLASLTVNGVLVERRDPIGSPDGAAFAYSTIVPLDYAAHRARIRDPGLEIRIWCASDRRCAAARRMAEGVRF